MAKLQGPPFTCPARDLVLELDDARSEFRDIQIELFVECTDRAIERVRVGAWLVIVRLL